MRFDILTLFPALVDTVLSESIIGRARESGRIEVYAHNIRDWSADKRRRVDDTPYGGGRGMLMGPQAVVDCCEAVMAMAEGTRRVVYMSPKGTLLNHAVVKRLATYDRLIILCGHYEGIDQRAIDLCVDEEISIGDYVVTGGELPACILVDAVARLCDGVLAAPECYECESVASGLLEFPQYTRPPVFRGLAVPEILLSGDHGKVDAWRRERALELTRRLRPDLIAGDGKADAKDGGAEPPQS